MPVSDSWLERPRSSSGRKASTYGTVALWKPTKWSSEYLPCALPTQEMLSVLHGLSWTVSSESSQPSPVAMLQLG